MSDWYPIETAPKDGTEIIYSGKYEGAAWVSVGRWTDQGWYDINIDSSDHYGHAEYPTHWMPLPQPPAESPARTSKEKE